MFAIVKRSPVKLLIRKPAAPTSRFEALLIRVFVMSPALSPMRCHQRAERSFSIRGRQFQICARCTGLVAGACAFPLAMPIGHFLPPLCAVALLLMLLDGGTQLAGLRESRNWIRFATGFSVTASSLALLTYLIGSFLVWRLI